MIVKFNSVEIGALEELAHARNDPKIGKVPNQRIDDRQNDLDMNLGGLKAELAVAKLLQCELDTSISIAGRRKPYDLQAQGKTIEVVYNTYRGGDLYFNKPDRLQADVAVLVVPFRKGVNVVGYITRGEFNDLYRWKSWGYGWRASIWQGQLHPIEELMQEQCQQAAMSL